jgi:tRNA U34 2-thiouridine synthase MnmA/TrmU
MAKTVALFSGGLDSTLAILTVLRQGIEIKALKFLTPFDQKLFEGTFHSLYLFSVAEKFGFEVKLIDLSDKFIDIVKNPKFGYGKNMNPCIDCKILMLKEARIFMDTIGADFIITGEVLGQRPMSQRKGVIYCIDKEAGVTDYVLRPLSAKLLKVTTPEARGIINRDMLYDFRGRSRKPQMTLAKEFRLTDYPAPAGGCLLTEPNYAHRLKDLLAYTSSPNLEDLKLLRIGRHFRFSPSCKIIVGRNKAENEKMLSISVKGVFLKVEGCGSPITLILGDITDEAIRVAASLCARYSDAKNLSKVEVSISKNDFNYLIKVQPAKDDLVREYRVELNKPAGKQITDAV